MLAPPTWLVLSLRIGSGRVVGRDNEPACLSYDLYGIPAEVSSKMVWLFRCPGAPKFE